RLHEQFSQEEIVLLQSRARRVAAPIQGEAGTGVVSALIAEMGLEKYALPIHAITAVYQHVFVTRLPCVPDFVAGIANVRGHVITVLDLAVILGAEHSAAATAALIVVDADGASVGFRIENLGEVAELALGDLDPIDSNMSLAHPEYFQGIFSSGIA